MPLAVFPPGLDSTLVVPVTIGAMVAALTTECLGWDFVDTDECVERAAGMKVSGAFRLAGSAAGTGERSVSAVEISISIVILPRFGMPDALGTPVGEVPKFVAAA